MLKRIKPPLNRAWSDSQYLVPSGKGAQSLEHPHAGEIIGVFSTKCNILHVGVNKTKRINPSAGDWATSLGGGWGKD